MFTALIPLLGREPERLLNAGREARLHFAYGIASAFVQGRTMRTVNDGFFEGYCVILCACYPISKIADVLVFVIAYGT